MSLSGVSREDIGQYYSQARQYLKQEQWLKAIELFHLIYCLQWDVPWNLKLPDLDTQPPSAAPLMTSLHKLDHDVAQMAYLLELGLLNSEFQPRYHQLKYIRDIMAANPQIRAAEQSIVCPIPPAFQAQIQDFYDKNYYYEEVPAVAKAVNPHLDAAAIEAQFFEQAPGMVTIDQLLTPEALSKLYHFCLVSTIWHDFQKLSGFMGSYMHTGFNCELLYQIAFELRETFPNIFKRRPLTEMWAYKYDSTRQGIEVHADAADINVNFWVTPDSANLDPASGGLTIYDIEAPKDWGFGEYNTSTEKIYQFLETAKAQKHRVPYRCNRAVLFNSNLFHETDRFQFQPGYVNRRINITLLYGER